MPYLYSIGLPCSYSSDTLTTGVPLSELCCEFCCADCDRNWNPWYVAQFSTGAFAKLDYYNTLSSTSQRDELYSDLYGNSKTKLFITYLH